MTPNPDPLATDHPTPVISRCPGSATMPLSRSTTSSITFWTSSKPRYGDQIHLPGPVHRLLGRTGPQPEPGRSTVLKPTPSRRTTPPASTLAAFLVLSAQRSRVRAPPSVRCEGFPNHRGTPHLIHPRIGWVPDSGHNRVSACAARAPVLEFAMPAPGVAS